MDFIARVRLVVDVPFSHDTDGPIVDDHNQGHDESRIEAARRAETELVDALKRAAAKHGVVVFELVEEVRER